jgi:signal transduction histidine kinase
LEAVLAGIGDGVLVADTEGRLVLMNPVAARLFALERPVAGAPIRSLLSADDLVDLLEETAVAGRVFIRELPIAAAGFASDGQPRTFQALAAPLYRASEAGEQVGGVVVVLRDITAQKELERMKSNFLSVVSHELKTPLHSIKGFVEIILMGKTGPVTDLQRDFLGTVQEQTGHLQRMIEDLLEFSRLESGQVRLRPVLMQPAELVMTVVEKLEPLAHKKGLSLTCELAEGLPEIEADVMRLEQVLTNLVENAIKFTPEGGRVQVRGWDRGDALEIVVIDSGIGVPAEERERIFERFYQVDSSARRRYKGTGLGLTICKHIVSQHGGRIWVQDAEGGGSQFHVVLPKTFPHEATHEAALDFGALAYR